MNYYNDCVDNKIHPKEFEANLNPCLIKGDRVHTILTYQLGYLSAVDLDKYKIMYDRNGENHYDMIKRDDAKNQKIIIILKYTKLLKLNGLHYSYF